MANAAQHVFGSLVPPHSAFIRDSVQHQVSCYFPIQASFHNPPYLQFNCKTAERPPPQHVIVGGDGTAWPQKHPLRVGEKARLPARHCK